MPEKVVIIARIVPRAGKMAELRDILQRMLAPTRVEEGCIAYNLHENVGGGSTIFSFYEIWRSQEDLDRHMETVHVRGLIDCMDRLVDGEIDIERLRLLET